jgi:solute carrier family 39 (zinc transporter), member 7
VVQDLSAEKAARAQSTSSSISRLFSILFPGSPAVNALLATLYISGPPNFLLALCPPNIDPSSLSVMVAFAVGGLMGDTLFHLLPEIFVGEDDPERARFVLVEPNRNLLLGAAILVGFMTFVAMDKGLRIATGGEGGHDHSHGHGSAHEDGTSSTAVTKVSGVDLHAEKDTLSSRKKAAGGGSEKVANGVQVSTGSPSEKEMNLSVKLGGYLNLM